MSQLCSIVDFDVIIYDKMMPNECCLAYLFETIGVKSLETDRKNQWNIDPSTIQGLRDLHVLICGTYSKENLDKILKVTKDVTLVVYSDTYEGNYEYVWTMSKLTSDLFDFLQGRIEDKIRTICQLFIKRQNSILSENEKCIVQAVKMSNQEEFMEKLKSLTTDSRSLDDLEKEGRIAIKTTNEIVKHWFKQGIKTTLVDHLCYVCHANPLIHDTIDHCFGSIEVDLVLVYRIEGRICRFTLASKDIKKLKANVIVDQLKKTYPILSGGGQDNMSGFAMNLVDGARFLDEILN